MCWNNSLYTAGPIMTAQDARNRTEAMVHLYDGEALTTGIRAVGGAPHRYLRRYVDNLHDREFARLESEYAGRHQSETDHE